MTLTEKQKQYLRDHVEDLWITFVEEDPDLMTSVCDCCINKREMIKLALSITDTDDEAFKFCVGAALKATKLFAGLPMTSENIVAMVVAAETAIRKTKICRPYPRTKLPDIALLKAIDSIYLDKWTSEDEFFVKKERGYYYDRIFRIKVEPEEI